MKKIARDIGLVSIGIASLTRDLIEANVREFVRNGQINEADGRKLVKKLLVNSFTKFGLCTPGRPCNIFTNLENVSHDQYLFEINFEDFGENPVLVNTTFELWELHNSFLIKEKNYSFLVEESFILNESFDTTNYPFGEYEVRVGIEYFNFSQKFNYPFELKGELSFLTGMITQSFGREVNSTYILSFFVLFCALSFFVIKKFKKKTNMEEFSFD